MPRLHLSNDEYDALYILLNNIGGCPDKSKRKHTSSISTKLYNIMQKRRGEIFSFTTSFEDNFYITEGNRMYWKDDIAKDTSSKLPPARHPNDPIGYTVVELAEEDKNSPCHKCEYVNEGKCDTAPCYIHQRLDKKYIYYVKDAK